MKYSFSAIALVFIAGGASASIGKPAMKTGLRCTAELPANDQNVVETASVDIIAVNTRQTLTSLILRHPGSRPLSIPYGDASSKTRGGAALLANQINDLKQTKILVIDPSIEESDGIKAENQNISFKIKVGYKMDPATKKAHYEGSLFYSLKAQSSVDNSETSPQFAGATTCTCIDAKTAAGRVRSD